MTDRERLGRAAFEAHYGGVSPTHAWEDISTGYREAWCVAAEAVREAAGLDQEPKP